jgi:hypothetical protein
VRLRRPRRVQRRNVKRELHIWRDSFRPLLRGRGRRKRGIPTGIHRSMPTKGAVKFIPLVFLCLLCACNRDSEMTTAERDSLDLARDWDNFANQPHTKHIWVWIPAEDTTQGEKLRRTLNDVLTHQGLGTTHGGGNVAVAGTNRPAYVFTVDTFASQKAIPAIISELKTLGVPKRTFLHLYAPDDKTIRVR